MALVITRRANQSFFIGDNIKVTILATKGGQVRIGIAAPQDVKILREELVPHATLTEAPNNV